MKTILLFLSLIAIVIVLSACEAKTVAYGAVDEMVIVVDSTEMEIRADSISVYFFTERQVPRREKSFDLKFIYPSQIEEYKFRRNFFLIGTLGSDSEFAGYLNRLLPEGFKNRVDSSDYNFTYVPDLYSYKQNGYIFVAPQLEDLLEAIPRRSEVVIDYISKKYWENMEESVFDAGEQDDLEEYFLNLYGSSLRIQHDYFVAKESQDSGFIWLRRIDPIREIYREILVRYYDNPDTIDLTPNWLIAQKEKSSIDVFRRYEVVVRDETDSLDTVVGSYSALKLEGTWRTEDLMIGGPFSMYGFYVDEQNKVVTIEVSITALGRRKTSFINQLEVIAESFHIRKTGN